jgi:hypothetical protein
MIYTQAWRMAVEEELLAIESMIVEHEKAQTLNDDYTMALGRKAGILRVLEILHEYNME